MEKIEFNFELNEEAKNERQEVFNKLKDAEVIQAWLSKHSLDEVFLEKHCYKFKDYYDRLHLCDQCDGLSGCMQKVKGNILELEYDGVLSKHVRPCKYMQQKEKDLAHMSKYLICDMSEEQLLYSFDNINLLEEKDSYLKLVVDMQEVCKKDGREGFYLCGEPGTGKTYLACCFINEMAKQGKKCAFVNVSNYFSTLKSKMYDKDAYANQINALKNAQVVVFDDVGGESVSNWTRDEILLPILNERMEKKRTTLFTSNYSLDNLQKYYAINSKLVNDEVGAKRLIERMKALSIEKVLNCSNRRLKKSRYLR